MAAALRCSAAADVSLQELHLDRPLDRGAQETWGSRLGLCRNLIKRLWSHNPRRIYLNKQVPFVWASRVWDLGFQGSIFQVLKFWDKNQTH